MVAIETLTDLVEVVTCRYVRLKVTTPVGTETIVCPDDFYDLVTELCAVQRGWHKFRIGNTELEAQLVRLGLVSQEAYDLCYPTPILKQVARDLIHAFEERQCHFGKNGSFQLELPILNVHFQPAQVKSDQVA